MNKNVMKIAIEAAKVLAGAAAGLVGGYFLGKKRAEKKAGEAMPADIPQIAVEEDEPDQESESSGEGEGEWFTMAEPPGLDYGWDISDGYAAKLKDHEPSSLEKELAESQAPDDDLPEDIPPEPPRGKRNRPYEISAEEFGEDNGYTKSFLNLYEGDGAITDEHDTLVENWRGMLGVDAPSHLEVDEAIQTVYIRNDKLSTDYELSRVDGRFFEEDEGEDDDR